MESDNSLEDQLASKEREWKDVLSAAVNQFKKAQDECSFYRTRYEQLREDFQFNLAILDERDRELARYDRLTTKALTVNHSCMTDEACKLTMDHERVKCDLQNKIHELERQLSIQRQEMTAAFQKELQDHKHYFNMKMNHMQALLNSRDLKMKLLYEDTKVRCQTILQTTQDRNVSKQFCNHRQTQQRHNEQHMKAISSPKDSRIKNLEEKLTTMEMKMKAEEEKYVEKYQDVLKTLKESEVQQEILCRAQSHHLQKAKKRIIKLQKHMDVLHDNLKKKEKTIHWYEQQLTSSLEREKNLEIMRTQIELKWQRCCENMKTEHDCVNEQELIQNENQVKEELRKKEETLRDLTVAPTSTNMKDHSFQCLSPAPKKIYSLQECNAELQAIVSQMKKEMEALLLQFQVQSQASLTLGSCHGLPAQISTHLFPQCNDIHTKTSQANAEDSPILQKQGGLWQEQNDNSVSLMPLVCTEKLQEEKQHLRQQHSSNLISGDMLKNVQQSPVQHARLKRAALCITRLIKEKQHLIEMCNRLRGMMSSSGVKELDLSTELQQHENLKQHQFQLLSQCPLAGRGRASNLNEQEDATAKEVTANSPSQETDGPEVSRNSITQSEVRQTGSTGYVDPNLSRSIESLQSLWDLLDYGLSSSTLSEEGGLHRTDPAESGTAVDEMIVCGTTAPVHSQPPNKLLQRKNLATAKKTTRILKPRPKIRNYNIKD